ncbi:hypothetical protein SAMN05216226_10262 [Halovenus aranensis]|uniref:Uncharacterized protein n=1 Tax=Halovenus aranensis TaxID=890420 RepID=A0A1G8SN93_9EURY|nr:hypothetical protein [Halovenus aranensis]SDJ30687.1 hypothetical protein SAMN05216226_10262 [Halovenus aranensis]
MSNDNTTRRRLIQVAGASTAAALAGCLGGSDDDSMDDESDGSMADSDETDGDDGMDGSDEMDDGPEPTDPSEAPRATVDRFSEEAGTLLVRTEENGLPAPDEPVDFDQGPHITKGLGPDGEMVEYYNFDVQPETPAPIYALFHENGDPVEGQLNVLDVIPGDDGYNDFWHVHKVTVPDDYEANVVTSVDDITEAGYDVEPTGMIKNCPVVPEGSTASKHFGDDHDEAPVVDGWYGGEVVSYFLFEEDSYEATSDGKIPLSPIYVSFNTNPGQEGGGPASGFMTEEGSDQTHNVVATVPGDDGYSPLWMVNPYDNADFDDVSDLDSATDANVLAMGAATVNCPIVSMG